MVLVAGLHGAITSVGQQNRRRCRRNPPPVSFITSYLVLVIVAAGLIARMVAAVSLVGYRQTVLLSLSLFSLSCRLSGRDCMSS
ncbi:hypothetical protein PIB30_065916 [Stylosanthes scabra]|uniref:Uncharacterized protein n=1 Tax=Stylosanthes scabra TaxID=79078 RepID=A0ABU6TNR0_9FABA|nr:hypothetical protein [Stylosanthes scabra]